MIQAPMAKEEDFGPSSCVCHRLNNNSLYKLCSPFLIFMRIGGAFFLPTTTTNYSSDESTNWSCEASPQEDSKIRKNRSRTEIFEKISKFYCFVAFLAILGYAGRFLYGFVITVPKLGRDFSGQDLAVTLSKFANLIWFVNVICVQIIFIRACWNKSLIFQLFTKWEDWRYISRNNHCKSFSERFLPRRNIIVVLTVIVMIPQLLSMWLPALSPGPEFGALTDIVFDGFHRNNSLVAAVTVTGHFFASFIYIVPVFLFALIGLAIEGEFCRFNYDLATQITEDGQVESGSLEWFRLRHGKLCAFLELADEIFAFYGLITIGIGVFEIFSLVFVVSALGHDETRGIAVTLAQIYWFSIYVFQPGLVMWTGMRVNEAAHAPLSKLYRVDQTRLSTQEALQLQSFTGRLACTRLGFTAWRMFTIDATAMLSLMGLYVTYQLLLFQLQIDLSSSGNVSTIPETHFRAGNNLTTNSTFSQ